MRQDIEHPRVILVTGTDDRPVANTDLTFYLLYLPPTFF
ncbi:MAG: hypothetical protein AVDCRST_MAG93-4966, partial [uncultured Chloroflexia bacterium]